MNLNLKKNSIRQPAVRNFTEKSQNINKIRGLMGWKQETEWNLKSTKKSNINDPV